MEGKEFKKEEYKIELKLVALLGVNEINELKDKIPELIKKRIEHYNYPYMIEKDKLIGINTMNMRGYISCSISKYANINEEERDFMNNEVAQIRKNMGWEFTQEQSKRILEIYNKMEKEISDTFNDSLLFKKKFRLSEVGEKEKEKKCTICNDKEVLLHAEIGVFRGILCPRCYMVKMLKEMEKYLKEVSEVDKLNLCKDCKEKILNRLYYICATYQSIAGRRNTYKKICKIIYDITGNENYNPNNPNWEEEPNELIRITELLENKGNISEKELLKILKKEV